MHLVLLAEALLVGSSGLLGIIAGGSILPFAAGISIVVALGMIITIFSYRVESLRAEEKQQYLKLISQQRHEFLNHLQVILGLLQLGRYHRALQYVQNIVRENELTVAEVNSLPPQLAWMFLDNLVQARKLGLKVEIECASPLDGFSPSPLLVNLFDELFDYLLAQAWEGKIEAVRMRLGASQAGHLTLRTTLIRRNPGAALPGTSPRMEAIKRAAARLNGEIKVTPSPEGLELAAILGKPAEDGYKATGIE